MRPWSDLYPKVAPWTPGASDLALDEALRQAAIAFCEETQCLQRTLDATRTRAGASRYDLELDRGEAVAQLLAVAVDGVDADLIAPRQARARTADTTLREKLAAYTRDRATLYLLPAPATTGLRIDVEAVIKPSQSAEGLPGEVFEQFAQGIAFGAIALLCSQKDKPYSDLQMAATAGGAFETSKRQASDVAATGGARVRLRVKPY